MDMWGAKMLQAVTGVAALAAEGFGLPADAFTKRMQVGVLWGVNMPVLASASRSTPPPNSSSATTKQTPHHPQDGPHLLAPTGSDFSRHGQEGTVLAGFHYDLNFLTIHGRSRYPGLFIWLRDGRRVLVRVPEGCLLVQAGKQMEYLTGGHVLAGFHEVREGIWL